MRSLVATLLLVFSLLSCGGESPSSDPLNVSLRMRFKGSCGQTPNTYDTQCLKAVQLVTIKDGATVAQKCVDISEPIVDLTGIANIPRLTLATLDNQGSVVFAIRGLHTENGIEDPCQNARVADWLLWGESAEINLAEIKEDTVVDIRLDCRSCLGGCNGLGNAQCPAELPPSYCVPFQLGLSCERRCDDASECYEGSIKCDAESGRCDTNSADRSGNEGNFCFACTSALDCDTGKVCVAQPGATTGLCTESCPFARCLEGATCQPLGPNLTLLNPPSGG